MARKNELKVSDAENQVYARSPARPNALDVESREYFPHETPIPGENGYITATHLPRANRQGVASQIGRARGNEQLMKTLSMIQRREGPAIRPMTPAESRQADRRSRTFELKVVGMLALGPLLSIKFLIRKAGHSEWSYMNFFGAGPALALHLPILGREGNTETFTTPHPMKVRQLFGRGFVRLVGIPNTDVKFVWLSFMQGPDDAGFASVTWRLNSGIAPKFGAGLYAGRFDPGHAVRTS